MRKIEEANVENGYVYDLSVEDNENYLTTSYLVHNSAAGSLVAFILGITKIDSIKHELIFERFLSEARSNEILDIDI